MKKKFTGKLVFKKDVISALNEEEMSNIVGGSEPSERTFSITSPRCPSYLAMCETDRNVMTCRCISATERCGEIPD